MGLLALCLFAFTACSKDDLNESFEQNKSLDVKQSINLKLYGSGPFQFKKTSYCQSGGIYVLTGTTVDGGLSEMTTRMEICKFDDSFYLDGTHVLKNGDELYFAAKEMKEDNVAGVYRITFTYQGGTGAFTDASGQTKVQLSTEGLIGESKNGQYEFKGQGIITY